MSSVMRQQRQELMEFIASLPIFDYLTIIQEDSDDVENEYERSLGPEQVNASGKQGILATFRTVFAPVDGGTDDVARVRKYIHTVRVLENVLINRSAVSGTLITYEEWIEMLDANITGIFVPTQASSPLITEPGGVRVVANEDYPGKEITFACTGGIRAPEMPTVEKPVIDAGDPGAITMTSATPGAAIFYTTDGSKPRPGKTLYTGPFAASGVTIRARAYLIGHLQPGLRDRDSITTEIIP